MESKEILVKNEKIWFNKMEKKMIFNTNPYGGMNGGKIHLISRSNVYEIDL
jgi:hypothetical protein